MGRAAAYLMLLPSGSLSSMTWCMCIGLPSKWTPLNSFSASDASWLLVNSTLAVPWDLPLQFKRRLSVVSASAVADLQ